MTESTHPTSEFFDVSVTQLSDRTIVAPQNALDGATIARFRKLVALNVPAGKPVTVNLAGVTVISSAGLDAILGVQERASVLDVECGSVWQRQLFEIAGLTHLLRPTDAE